MPKQVKPRHRPHIDSRVTARRGRASHVLAAVGLLLLSTSCARAVNENPGEPIDGGEASSRACDAPLSPLTISPESQTKLFGNDKRIIAAVDSAVDKVLLSVDFRVPEAGNESAPEGMPRLVSLSAEGTVMEIPLPEVDGKPIDPGVLPIGTDGKGTTFLYEALRGRLLTMDSQGKWDSVLSLDSTRVGPRPAIAFGAQNQPYLTLATRTDRCRQRYRHSSDRA